MRHIFILLLLSVAFTAAFRQNCYPETVYMTLGEYYSPEYSNGDDELDQTNCQKTLQISFSTIDECSQAYVIVQNVKSDLDDGEEENNNNNAEDHLITDTFDFSNNYSQKLNNNEDSFEYSNIENNEDIEDYVQGIQTSIVKQSWNGEVFCHSGKKCEKVYYTKYVHYFSFNVCKFSRRFGYKIYGDITTSQPRVFSGYLPQKKRTISPQTFIAFGDHEISENGNYTISRLDSLLQKRKEYDALLFLGDYAYEFYQNNATKGDIYLNSMEPYFSSWPLMFSPGNHEDCYDFAFINEKFHMMNNITKQENNVFSFNIGRVHFLSVNLHHYNNSTGVIDPAVQESMLAAVEKDLILANRRRKQQPWVFILGHKPIYCVGRDECLDYYVQFEKFDKLFYRYGVDVFLAAHQHEYTQFYPMYNNQTMGYNKFNNILANPKSYIQVIQGNGGSNDMYHTDQFYNATWVFKRNFDPGYGTFTIVNDELLIFDNHDTKTNTTNQPTFIYSRHNYHEQQIY